MSDVFIQRFTSSGLTHVIAIIFKYQNTKTLERNMIFSVVSGFRSKLNFKLHFCIFYATTQNYL